MLTGLEEEKQRLLNGQENRSLGARKDRQHGKAVSSIANNC